MSRMPGASAGRGGGGAAGAGGGPLEAYLAQTEAYLVQVLPSLPAYRHDQRQRITSQVLALLRGFPSLGLSLGVPPSVGRVVSPALSGQAMAKGGILSLAGTIPITYHGERYSIPVAILLPPGFPGAPPECHVAPAPGMAIRPKHSAVDTWGFCHLAGCDWTSGRDELLDATKEMQRLFTFEPPLYSTSSSSSPSPSGAGLRDAGGSSVCLAASAERAIGASAGAGAAGQSSAWAPETLSGVASAHREGLREGPGGHPGACFGLRPGAACALPTGPSRHLRGKDLPALRALFLRYKEADEAAESRMRSLCDDLEAQSTSLHTFLKETRQAARGQFFARAATIQVSSALKAATHAAEMAKPLAPPSPGPAARSPSFRSIVSPSPAPLPAPYIRSQSLVHHRNAAGAGHPSEASGMPGGGNTECASGGGSPAFGALTSEVREGGASWPYQGRPRAHPATSHSTTGTPLEAHERLRCSPSQLTSPDGPRGAALCMSQSVDGSRGMHGRRVGAPEGGPGRDRHGEQSVSVEHTEEEEQEEQEESEEVREAMRRDMVRLEQQVRQQGEAWERRRGLREEQRRQEEEQRRQEEEAQRAEEKREEERRERQRQEQIARMLEEGRRRAAEEKRDIEARIALGAAAALARARATLAQAQSQATLAQAPPAPHAASHPVPSSPQGRTSHPASGPYSAQGTPREQTTSPGAEASSPWSASAAPEDQSQALPQTLAHSRSGSRGVGTDRVSSGNPPQGQRRPPVASPMGAAQRSREQGTGGSPREQGKGDALQWGASGGEHARRDALREWENGVRGVAPGTAAGVPGASHVKGGSQQATLRQGKGPGGAQGSAQGEEWQWGHREIGAPVAQRLPVVPDPLTDSWGWTQVQDGSNARDVVGAAEAWAGAATEAGSGASALDPMVRSLHLSSQGHESHAAGASMVVQEARGVHLFDGGSSFSSGFVASAQQQLPAPAPPAMSQVSTDSFLFCSVGGGILDASACVTYHSSSN